MQRRPLFISLLSLTAILTIGCNDAKSTRALVDTKALYQVSASDTLIIHIEDDGQNGEGSEDNNTQQNEAEESNQPPEANVTANGHTDFVQVHVGEPVFFSSEGSHDPDGRIVKYIWTDMDENVLSTDENFTRTFYVPAIYEKTLTVIDDKNASAQRRVCILADITPADIALIAHAGPDVITNTNTHVVIEGRAVCKTGDFSYEWREGEVLLSESAILDHVFTEGEHMVTLKVTDNTTGKYALDSVKITVKPASENGGD